MVRQNLIDRLADGRFHSGEALAKELGVTRAAIWKQVRALADIGLDVFKVPGKGYRLAQPIELLDLEKIKRAAGPGAAKITHWDLRAEVNSTNSELRLREHVPGMEVCIAEYQVDGRGRRGRTWISPYGANIYLSFSMLFPEIPANISAASLAVGVICTEALKQIGVTGVGLKWPNDLLWQDRKFGGILLEMDGEASGPCKMVIGIGINVHMPGRCRLAGGIELTDLQEAGYSASRNELAGVLIGHLVTGMERFREHGFAAFRAAWEEHDVLAGKTVNVQSGDEVVSGEVVGYEDHGAMLLRTKTGVQKFLSGDVSVRV